MWNNGGSLSRVATEANSSCGMASVDECRHGRAGSRREDRANAPISASATTRVAGISVPVDGSPLTQSNQT